MADNGIWKNAQSMRTNVTENIEILRSVWTIDNFMALQNIPNGERIRSDSLYGAESEWSIIVYPNGYNMEYRDHIGIFLSVDKLSPAASRIKAEYQFHLLDQNDQVIYSAPVYFWRSFKPNDMNGWINQLILTTDIFDKSKGFLTDNKFKIGIELKIIKNVEIVSLGLQQEDYKTSTNRMVDFSSFLDKSFTDVEIEKTDGISIRAHKVILAKHSPVLARMFLTSMKEASKSRAEIKNINTQTLDGLLRFIYSGKINQDQVEDLQLIQELIFVADQYEVIPLKELCENLLIQDLTKTWENAFAILKVGHLCNCADLKEAAITSIVMNKDNILNAPECKEFFTKNPKLTQEVMCKITKVNPKRSIDEVDGAISVQPQR